MLDKFVLSFEIWIFVFKTFQNIITSFKNIAVNSGLSKVSWIFNFLTLLSILSHFLLSTKIFLYAAEGCTRSVMVKAMDFGLVVSEFVLQSRSYVHFRANTLGERYEPPYPPSYGL